MPAAGLAEFVLVEFTGREVTVTRGEAGPGFQGFPEDGFGAGPIASASLGPYLVEAMAFPWPAEVALGCVIPAQGRA